MDRRHGKRPLPSEASEAKEKEHDNFPSYSSSWSESDMSAMVSALTQVIGTSDEQSSMVQSNPSDLPAAVKEEPDPPQQTQDQGISYITQTSIRLFSSSLSIFRDKALYV